MVFSEKNRETAPSDTDNQWELSDARTIFISDVHLGSRYAQVDQLLELLRRCLPQKIYLVGDLFDQRRMSRRMYWSVEYTQLLLRLFELGQSGTEVYFAPGNHDSYLRLFEEDFRLFEIRDSFVHQCADGKRIAVLHGDQFDMVERQMKWLSELGSIAYEILLRVDRSINWLVGLLCSRHVPLSRSLKSWAKRLVQRQSEFHDLVCKHARDEGCEGVICGHIHNPEITQIDEITYCNTGDWIEHCSAIVEWPDGRLQLIDASTLSSGNRERLRFRRIQREKSRHVSVKTPV